MTGLFSAAVIGAFLFSLFRHVPSAVPLLYRCPVVFLERGHPCFQIFYSSIPVVVVVVVRAKSCVNRLFDRLCVFQPQ